jgi:hypothetical protein
MIGFTMTTPLHNPAAHRGEIAPRLLTAANTPADADADLITYIDVGEYCAASAAGRLRAAGYLVDAHAGWFGAVGTEREVNALFCQAMGDAS